MGSSPTVGNMEYYKHNKTGNDYVLIGYAINCTNERDGEEIVIYRKLYETQMFVRNKQEFLQKFTKHDHDNPRKNLGCSV